jgi:hypothetical protein
VTPFRGVHSSRVPEELAQFERSVARDVAALDAAVPVAPPGQPWPGDALALGFFVALAARLHGEWVRIHPFANGNGRTARLWVAWCALRYGLPRSCASSRGPRAAVTPMPRPAPCKVITNR